MKRLLTATLALTLLGGSAAVAQPYGHDNHGYDRHDDRGGHRWARGQRLPTTYYRDRGHYIDYRAHHLRAPPRGYRWVQADNDYALVAITSGLISELVAASR